MSSLPLDSDPIRQFEMLEKLGEGSYGSVFKARFKPTGETYAIKSIPFSESETVNQALQEVRVMEGVDNEYVVSSYGNFVYDDKLFIILEYCGAGSVADVLRLLDRTLSESEIASIARDSLRGLAYMHEKKKIHRDIKAGNLLLTEKGVCKLADFGVTGQLSDHTIKRSTLTGTPYWMAPEVVLESGYDGKADVWSLGITCIEMAHGKPPYHSVKPMLAMIMIPNKQPPQLDENKNFSPEFRDFVFKCLTKNPADRPTALEVLEHPFLQKAKGISPMIEEVLLKISEKGILENPGEDEEEEAGTVKAPRYSDDTSKMYSFDTVKKNLPGTGGTMQPQPPAVTYSDDTMKVMPAVKPLPDFNVDIPVVMRDDDVPVISMYFEDNTSITSTLEAVNINLQICRESASPPPNSVCFKSKVISRVHCIFGKKDDRYFIQDVGSSSGTFLNQMRLSESKKKSEDLFLKQGDEIRLGVSLNEKSQEIPEDSTNVPEERRCVRIKVLMILQDDEFPKGNLVLGFGTKCTIHTTSGPKRRIE